MSNSFYNYARELAATSGLNWVSGTMHVAAIDAGAYTFDPTHKFLTDVAAAAFIAPNAGVQSGQALSSKSATDGACDAADAVMTSVTGVSIEAVIVFNWTGSAATSLLYAYLDTGSGLPITPNGGNITFVWDNGTNKIFRP